MRKHTLNPLSKPGVEPNQTYIFIDFAQYPYKRKTNYALHTYLKCAMRNLLLKSSYESSTFAPAASKASFIF